MSADLTDAERESAIQGSSGCAGDRWSRSPL